MRRLKNIALNLILVFISCVFVLLILEIGVRIFIPLVKPHIITRSGTPGKPFFEGTFLSTEYTIDIKINSEGFRDIEHELIKPTDVFRILAVGDSFTFGLGVQADLVYPEMLERILNEKNRHKTFRYEVFNMGIANIGTLEELRIIKEGIKYKPDLILLGLLAENRWNAGNGNDLCDNFKSWCRSKDNKLIKLGSGGPFLKLKVKLIDYANSLQGFLAEHSTLYFLVMTKKGTALRRQLIRFREDQKRDEIDMGWDITKDTLKKINAIAQEAGAKFVIVRIPFLYDVYNTKPDRVSEILIEFGKVNNINICDLLKILRKNKNLDLYYPADGHWKPAAHMLAAKEIYNYLIRNSLLIHSQVRYE